MSVIAIWSAMESSALLTISKVTGSSVDSNVPPFVEPRRGAGRHDAGAVVFLEDHRAAQRQVTAAHDRRLHEAVRAAEVRGCSGTLPAFGVSPITFSFLPWGGEVARGAAGRDDAQVHQVHRIALRTV